MTDFTIGQLARYAGVHVETIRFYQRRRLIKAPPRPRGGVRRYGAADVARVRFIKAAQRIGFDLREISELLKLDDGTYCAEARTLAEKKLADVHERVTALRSIETALKQLVNECRSRRGTVSCPLIASLQNSAQNVRA